MTHTTLASHTSLETPYRTARRDGVYMRGVLCIMLASLLWCATASHASAQNIQFTQGSVGSGLDNTLQISLRAYPGRGGASLPVTLYYSSKVWRIKYTATIHNPYDVSFSEAMTEAKYAEHSAAGWTSSLGVPIIEWPEPNVVYNYQGKPVCLECRSGTPFSPGNYWKIPGLTVHMPDGSTHELRRDDTPYTGAAINEGVYYAVDGSRLRYDTPTPNNPATLFLPDGARYQFLQEGDVRFIDRNGNALNYDGGNQQWSDTLGRTIPAPQLAGSPGTPYYYSLPGLDGTTVTYIFRYQYLSNALEPDPETGTMPQLGYAGSHYTNGTPTYTNPPQSLPGPYIFQSTENGEGTYNYVIAPQSLFNPGVLSEIELPNGLKYKFTYNEFGEIAKVVYPTGAFEQYKYAKIVTPNSSITPYDQASRGVASRWLSANGTGTDRVRWTYTSGYDTSINKYKQTITAPNNLYTVRYFFNAPLPSQYTISGSPRFGYQDPRNMMVYDERVYEYQNGPMLRRKLTDWANSSRTVTVGFNGQTTQGLAMRNPRPTKEVSLILDTGDGANALAKTMTYSYETTSDNEFTTGLNQIRATESHFDNVSQATAQSATATATAISPGTGTLSSIVDTAYLNDVAYQYRNILGLATSVELKDANWQTVSKTEMFYDEAAYPLLTYSDLASVSYYTDPATNARGNVTTVRRYVSISPNLYLETHAQYDQCGNVRNSWNERGIQSQTEYSSTYMHAYPTLATTAAPDPTGAHGSNTAFTSSSVFDFWTGLALSSTDANEKTTIFSYRDEQNTPDPLNRLRKVTRPDGSWTRYSFNDVVGSLYMQTETQLDATRVTTARQYFDMLGRSVRSFAYENTDPSAQWLGSDIYYDQLGRVSQVSNAYRTSLPSATQPSSCSLCTTSTYDVLGRVKTVTLPDGTTAQTTYQGIYTTVEDQAGKQRRQKVDALGRVVRVDEPNAVGDLGEVSNPAQATYYGYNTQGNLVYIQQGAGANIQHRYFKYDALSRLTYERQVEQAAIFTATDSVTGNNQWSRKVVYDENGYQGLPTTMTDARNISTQYNYDNLNRIYQVTYSDGTPTVQSFYDQARTGYVNKGRLTEVQTAAVAAQGAMPAIPATSQVYDFDLMGRVKRQQQAVGNQSYTLSYTYNLGGQLTSQTYPSGRVVTYGFDDAARLSSVTSGATTYVSQFDYSSPQGLLKSVTLGNGAVESYDYNTRLQMKTLTLAKDSNVLQKYEYKYGQVDANTGAVDETKNNGQIGRIEGYIGTAKQWQQRFSYDSIGRLSQAREYRGDNNQQSYLINYNYDTVGNRYQYQASNPNALAFTAVEDSHIDKLTNRFNSGVTYDDAGNILTDSKFRQRQYSYDANGRQRWTANLDGTLAATSVYDGAGQRVATIANGVTSYMVYDAGGKLVAEYGTSATGGRQYVFADHQGSTRVVTNQGGGVISRQDYQPFGEELGAVGMRSSDSYYGGANNARQKYAGMEKDDASGMSHTLWRKYDGISGRWTSPDPYGGSMSVSDPQSFNRYTYVNNDPVNKVDLLGLMLSDIGVHQTQNPAVAAKLERAMVQLVQQNTSQGSSRSTPGLNKFAAPSVKSLVSGSKGSQAQKRQTPPTEKEIEVTNNSPESGGYQLFAFGADPVAFNGEPILDNDGKVLKEGNKTYDKVWGFGIYLYYELRHEDFPAPDKGTVVTLTEHVTGTLDGVPTPDKNRTITLQPGEDGRYRFKDFIGLTSFDPSGPRQLRQSTQKITLNVTIEGAPQSIPIRENRITIDPRGAMRVRVIDQTKY